LPRNNRLTAQFESPAVANQSRSSMRFLRRILPILLLFIASHLRSEEAIKRLELTVDGVARELLVYAPAKAKTEASPVIFAWHGHGGTMNSSVRSFHFHTLWPEAIVVYPQGLNTPGKLTDPDGKKPGWQHGPGAEGDRDLKFFDAILAKLHDDFKVDDRRIYSSGHSNGGGFTYLLWATRADKFAAFAPSASLITQVELLKPKPALHVAGENDPLVKFQWQKAMMDAVRKTNQCGEGQPWELDSTCTYYPSKVGAPFVTAIHPGTHQYPTKAPEVIVKFFKSQVLPSPTESKTASSQKIPNSVK
jgi:polyhydroxybutyrate depolymerase